MIHFLGLLLLAAFPQNNTPTYLGERNFIEKCERCHNHASPNAEIDLLGSEFKRHAAAQSNKEFTFYKDQYVREAIGMTIILHAWIFHRDRALRAKTYQYGANCPAIADATNYKDMDQIIDWIGCFHYPTPSSPYCKELSH